MASSSSPPQQSLPSLPSQPSTNQPQQQQQQPKKKNVPDQSAVDAILDGASSHNRRRRCRATATAIIAAAPTSGAAAPTKPTNDAPKPRQPRNPNTASAQTNNNGHVVVNNASRHSSQTIQTPRQRPTAKSTSDNTNSSRPSSSSFKISSQFAPSSRGASSSAFQRRNARDTLSRGMPPPPTMTDVTLAAMLDTNYGGGSLTFKGNGKRRGGGGAANTTGAAATTTTKTTTATNKMSNANKTNNGGQQKRGLDSLLQHHDRPASLSSSNNNTIRSNNGSKRQKVPSPNSVMLDPPPIASYHINNNNQNNNKRNNNNKSTAQPTNGRLVPLSKQDNHKQSQTKARKRVSSHVYRIKSDHHHPHEEEEDSKRFVDDNDAIDGADTMEGKGSSQLDDKGEIATFRSSIGKRDDGSGINNDGETAISSAKIASSMVVNTVNNSSVGMNESASTAAEEQTLTSFIHNPYKTNKGVEVSECRSTTDATHPKEDDAMHCEGVAIPGTKKATETENGACPSSGATATEDPSAKVAATTLLPNEESNMTVVSLLGIGGKRNRKKQFRESFGASISGGGGGGARRCGPLSNKVDGKITACGNAAPMEEVSRLQKNDFGDSFSKEGRNSGGLTVRAESGHDGSSQGEGLTSAVNVSQERNVYKSNESHGGDHGIDSNNTNPTSTTTDNTKKYADWFDPDEHAEMEKEASSNATMNDVNDKYSSRSRKSNAGVNDNFVRLDLRNSAGACRGARNLKKANKHNHWRAQHRFGMSDSHAKEEEDTGSGNEAVLGGGEKPRYPSNKKRYSKGSAAAGGDLKCFSSARNGGVDALDDFIDGAFTIDEKDGDGNKHVSEKRTRAGQDGKKTGGPKRDETVPLCTRHQRQCKLLIVKRNHKGNKGRKFFVCSMPKGEQCDFFKWEEDTMEAAQRALLQSSSSSGFIARQVAAAKKSFNVLTVPELRIEAKKRGLKAAGKKGDIVTRLLVWTRDEIARSVEPDEINNDADSSLVIEKSSSSFDKDEQSDTADDKSERDDNSDEECGIPDAEVNTKTSAMIDLSDDESFSDDESDGDESSCDEIEVCAKEDAPTTNGLSKRLVFNKSEATLYDALGYYFGYSDFREGQEWAIRRCLSNERTLLVAPTGQGKSLCYALPAALAEGICLVVSPLISLMQDQLRQLPPKIPAATLSGSMTQAQMALIVDDILRGRYKVLFVSPERLASAAFRRLVRPKFNVETRQFERQFPTVSLLCVDEAHCLSQWGHNFRPSYLRVRSLLPLLEPKSVLALTATAGPLVVRDICKTLCIPFDGEGLNDRDHPPDSPTPTTSFDLNCIGKSNSVKVLNCNRDNIDVFSLVLQNDDERRYLLCKILKEKKKDSTKKESIKKLPIQEGCLSKGSVIVYVWRQKDTEIISEQLNAAGVSGGVVCYHGGMDSNDRTRAQSKFLRGKARICVATVAFGLGIDKPDIEGVIHLCLPPSPEHYLQEIGRAGRDGRSARAIALPLIDEVMSRHSLAHSDRLSKNQLDIVFLRLQKLIEEALGDIPPEAGVDLGAEQVFIDDLHIAVPVLHTVDASDCKEESIETIFSLLEEESSSNPSLMSVEGYLPDVATVTFKKRSVEQLGKIEEIARSILKCGSRMDEVATESIGDTQNQHNRYQGDFGGTAMEKGFFAYSFGTYKFSVIRCARCIGPKVEPRHIFAMLRRLQGSGELELSLDTTQRGRAMHLKMKQEGIRLFRMREGGHSCTEENISVSVGTEAIISNLSKQFLAKEKISVEKVEAMYEIMHQVSCEDNMDEPDDCDEFEKSSRLVTFQRLVQNYFCNGSVHQTGGIDATSYKTEDCSHKAPIVVKDFPIHSAHAMSFLYSDITSLMQVLRIRRQEQMLTAVHITGLNCSDYRDLCIAKILHAIDSPRAQILEWYSHPLWAKYRNYSFSSVVQAVKMAFEN